MQIAGTVRRHIYEHMPRNSAHSDHTSCMLDRIIRINELCSDTAHFRTLTHSKHFFQPVRLMDFYIIIQEKADILPLHAPQQIIDGRIIKFFFPISKDGSSGFRKALYNIGKNLISGTVILHDYDFKILITGILSFYLQTGLKGLFLVFVWYDNQTPEVLHGPDISPGKIPDPVYGLPPLLYLFFQDEPLLLSCRLQMHTFYWQDYLQWRWLCVFSSDTGFPEHKNLSGILLYSGR